MYTTILRNLTGRNKIILAFLSLSLLLQHKKNFQTLFLILLFAKNTNGLYRNAFYVLIFLALLKNSIITPFMFYLIEIPIYFQYQWTILVSILMS